MRAHRLTWRRAGLFASQDRFDAVEVDQFVPNATDRLLRGYLRAKSAATASPMLPVTPDARIQFGHVTVRESHSNQPIKNLHGGIAELNYEVGRVSV